ncbi:ComEC/Rec2 family competence protein [Acidobacteria bacterium AH-259-A15]|nr:ComEC/Rec2 family competence protein [Acidobacteria bacterium AH-259-A15]
MLQRLKPFCLFNPCFILAGLLAGVIGICHKVPRPQLPLEEDRVTEIEGWISRPAQLLDDYIYLELSPLSVKQQDKSISYPARLAVYISSSNPKSETYFDPPLAYGEILSVNGFLQDPSYYAIPGVADFRQILWNQGILHVVHLKSPLQVVRKGHHPIRLLVGPIFAYVQCFESFCHKQLNQSQLKLILSVFLGRKKTLEEIDRNLIKTLGIFHLFVVSGFHVSLVVLFLHWLFQRWGRPGRILTVLGLWVYVILVGWGAPTLRAGVMVTLFYLLLSLGLSRQFLNALGISALILLAVSPGSLFSSGFQFSYLCLSAIGLFVLPYEPLIRSLSLGCQDAFTKRIVVHRDDPSKLRRRVRSLLEEKLQFWPRKLSRFALPPTGRVSRYFLSLALCGWFIQLLTLPVSLYYTNRWIWTQWLSNLVLVPLFALFIPLCLLLFVTFWLPTGPILAQVVGVYAAGLSWLMSSLKDFTWITYLRQPEAFEITIYFLLFLCAYYLLPGRAKMAAFFSPIFLWFVLQQPAVHSQGKLLVTLLDVGQGESLHIRYPDGMDALVDTGGFFYSPHETSHFVGERLVSRYLWKERSQKLDYVLLTHPHSDHVQGYDFIREAFPIGRLLFYEFPNKYPGAPARRIVEGDSFSIAGVEHLVLHPPRQRPPGTEWNTNNSSLVVQLCYKDFKMLFTGDIERAAEQYLSPKLGPVTVLKAAHHGGRTSSSQEFLEKTQPGLALISAGRKSIFGHPSPVTLERFARAAVAVLATPQWGSLRIETDGLTWRVLHYSMEEGSFREVELEGLIAQ